MRFGAATVAMLAAGGCNWVFDLSKTTPFPDAPAIDGQYFDSGPDAPPDAFCTVSTITSPVEADGPIFQTNPNQGLSDLTLINLKGALQDRALFRFDVGGLPPGYVSLTLRLAYAEHDSDCGTSCASCASLEQAGDFDVHPVRSDWTERQGLDIGITWNCRAVRPDARLARRSHGRHRAPMAPTEARSSARSRTPRPPTRSSRSRTQISRRR